jgi:hypothetical protein
MIMKKLLLLVLSALLLLQGCATVKKLFQEPGEKAKPEGIGKSREEDLVVKVPVEPIVFEWGVPTEFTIDVTWAAQQKYPVQLTPGEDVPTWLTIELNPAIVEAPGRSTAKITAEVAAAGALDPINITINATAYGLSQPVPAYVHLQVRRQSGSLVPLIAAPVTVECSNICGKMERNTVTFYDILREKGQTCGDEELPVAQRIGPTGISLSRRGFGFGRTCHTAGIFENSGMLTFINLGLSPVLSRGARMLSLRSIAEAWLSPDNTVVVVRVEDTVAPYDVVTGHNLGNPFRLTGTAELMSLSGTTLSVGNCQWEIR